MKTIYFLRKQQINLLQTAITPTLPSEEVAAKIAELSVLVADVPESEPLNLASVTNPIVIPETHDV